MLRPSFTGAFKRDRRRAEKRGKVLAKLDGVVRLLIAEQPLDPRYRDHKLAGEWRDFRECHVEPDWLLIYRVEGEEITFVRTGTHADLFGE